MHPIVQKIDSLQTKIDYPRKWYKDSDLNFWKGYIEGLKFALKSLEEMNLHNNEVHSGNIAKVN